MSTATNRPGKISENFAGHGVADQDALEKRAREIAIINGRPPDKFNEDDLDQARREMTGSYQPSAEPDRESEMTSRIGVPGTAGHRKRVIAARDEQTVAEELVEEGVEEANHEQMVQGSRASREESQS